MTIPPFSIDFDADYREEFHSLCGRILDEKFLTDHSLVREFEFAKFSGITHAVAVSSGTAVTIDIEDAGFGLDPNTLNSAIRRKF